MDLNVKEAEKICKENLSKIKDGNLHVIHSKLVGDTALILSKGKQLNENLLKIAAWVHDIGYSIDSENHAEHSVEILEKRGYEVNKILRDCVLNHGASKNPKTNEGKIDRKSVV